MKRCSFFANSDLLYSDPHCQCRSMKSWSDSQRARSVLMQIRNTGFEPVLWIRLGFNAVRIQIYHFMSMRIGSRSRDLMTKTFWSKIAKIIPRLRWWTIFAQLDLDPDHQNHCGFGSTTLIWAVPVLHTTFFIYQLNEIKSLTAVSLRWPFETPSRGSLCWENSWKLFLEQVRVGCRQI